MENPVFDISRKKQHQNTDVLTIMYKEITSRLCTSCLCARGTYEANYFRFMEGPVPMTAHDAHENVLLSKPPQIPTSSSPRHFR